MKDDITIGPVRLICANALDVLADFHGVFDLVATDPPYKLTAGGKNGGSMTGKFSGDQYNNNGNFMPWVPWEDMAGPIFRAAKDNADAYVMANDKEIFKAQPAFMSAGWKFHNLLNWRKGAPTRNRWYMKDCEYTLYLWKGHAKTIRMPGSKQSFDCPRPKDGTHRTQKPIELFDLYVRNSTNPGDIVLDPFSGSGTTALAAMLSGRRAVGIELDPEIFRVSVARLEDAWRGIMSNQAPEISGA